MKWVVTQRRYHGQPDGRFLVHEEDALRGPVEFTDEREADFTEALLNSFSGEVLFTGMLVRAGAETARSESSPYPMTEERINDE